MSIFDRLGNLGKGLIHTKLNPDTTASRSAGNDLQAALRKALEEGRLTAEEYRVRLQALSQRTASPQSGDGSRTAPAVPDVEPEDDARADDWETRGPVKRTL